MNKIKSALKSRTVWAGILLFTVSGVEGVQHLIPESLLQPIQFILTALIAYFRVNPKE